MTDYQRRYSWPAGYGKIVLVVTSKGPYFVARTIQDTCRTSRELSLATTLCRTTLSLSVQLFYAARIFFLHAIKNKIQKRGSTRCIIATSSSARDEPNFPEGPEDLDCKESGCAGFNVERHRDFSRKRFARQKKRRLCSVTGVRR